MSDLTVSAQLDLARVVQGTIGVCRRNLPVLLLISALLGALPSFAATWGTYWFWLHGTLTSPNTLAISFAGWFLIVCASSACQAVMAVITFADQRRQKIELADVIAAALPRLPTILAINLLATFALMAGFALLVVPGCIIAAAISVIVPASMMEGGGPFAAFDRSRDLTRGTRGRIFGLLVLFWSLVTVIEWLAFMPFGGFTALSNPIVPQRLVIVPLLAFLTRGLACVGTSVLYLELSRLRGSPHVSELVEVFD